MQSKSKYAERETYGDRLVEILRAANRSDLAEFIKDSKDDYREAIAKKFRRVNDACIEEIAKDLALFQAQGVGDMFMPNAAEREWEKFNVVAKLVYVGLVDEYALYRPLTIEEWAALGPKFAATVKNPALRAQAFDIIGADADYKRLMEMSPDKNEMLEHFRETGAMKRWTFSPLFYGPLRAGGLSYNETKTALMCGTEVISPLIRDPIFDLPMAVADSHAYGLFLQRRTRSEVHVIKYRPYDLYLVGYVLANLNVKIKTGKDVECRRSGTPTAGCFDGAYSALGNQFLKAFSECARRNPPPSNLLSKTWLTTYVHYVLDIMFTEDPAFDRTYTRHMAGYVEDLSGVIEEGEEPELGALAKALSRWQDYKDVATLVHAMQTKVPSAPVIAPGVVNQELAVRRDLQNKNGPYNDMFRTSDASVVGYEDDEVADMAKHHELIALGAFEGATRANIYAVGSGNMISAFMARYPDMSLSGYDKIVPKNPRIPTAVWEISDGYAGSADRLYDMSYGEGENISAANNRKVAFLLRSNYTAGVIKFTMTREVALAHNATTGILLPYDLQLMANYFSEVFIVCPGKAHSPELFVVFKGRVSEPITGTPYKMMVGRMAGAIYAKCALMKIANTVRTFCWDHCAPLAWSDKMKDYVGPIWDDIKRITKYGRDYVLQPYTLDAVLNVVFSKKAAAYDSQNVLSAVSDFFKEVSDLAGPGAEASKHFLGEYANVKGKEKEGDKEKDDDGGVSRPAKSKQRRFEEAGPASPMQIQDDEEQGN